MTWRAIYARPYAELPTDPSHFDTDGMPKYLFIWLRYWWGGLYIRRRCVSVPDRLYLTADVPVCDCDCLCVYGCV